MEISQRMFDKMVEQLPEVTPFIEENRFFKREQLQESVHLSEFTIDS